MKWKTIVVLGLVAIAGCGGGDDDSSSNGDDGAAASTAPEAPATEPIKGKPTEAKVLTALGIEKTADGYDWGECQVKALAWTKQDVKALKEEAGAKAVQTNTSGIVGVQLSTQTLECGLKANALLKTIP